MNKRFQAIEGGKQKNYRPLVQGGGLSNLAIYITTAGGLFNQLTGTKQRPKTVRENGGNASKRIRGDQISRARYQVTVAPVFFLFPQNNDHGKTIN